MNVVSDYYRAKQLVERYHYLGTMPLLAKTVECTILEDTCAIVALPMGRFPSGVLELTRLVRSDIYFPLTKTISRCIKKLRGKCELLMTYADEQYGHHGGVYQAASFHYHGAQKPRLTGFRIDGVLLSCRGANHRYGTSSHHLVTILRQRGHTCEPVYTGVKHKYWKPIGRSGNAIAKALGLGSNSYPKPTKE